MSKYELRKVTLAYVLPLLLMLSLGPVSLCLAETSNNGGGPAATSATTDVVLSNTYYFTERWENKDPSTGYLSGWSDQTFSLTLGATTVVNITVYDSYWVGDAFELWILAGSTGFTSSQVILVTPEVIPDYHHGYAQHRGGCGSVPHTGDGSVYSMGQVRISLPLGTYYFRVRDYFFDILASESINPTTPLAWSPAAAAIEFHTSSSPTVPPYPSQWTCLAPPVGGVITRDTTQVVGAVFLLLTPVAVLMAIASVPSLRKKIR